MKQINREGLISNFHCSDFVEENVGFDSTRPAVDQLDQEMRY